MSFAQVQKKFVEYVKGGRRRYSKNLSVDICEYFYSLPPPTLPPLIDNIPALVEDEYQVFYSLLPPLDYYNVY